MMTLNNLCIEKSSSIGLQFLVFNNKVSSIDFGTPDWDTAHEGDAKDIKML